MEIKPLLDGSPEANLDFIFHNKVPKSGSSTMKHILNYLSKRNKFALDHVRIVKFGYEDNLRLAHHIPKFRSDFSEQLGWSLLLSQVGNLTTFWPQNCLSWCQITRRI